VTAARQHRGGDGDESLPDGSEDHHTIMTTGSSKGIFGVKEICSDFQPGGGTSSVTGPYRFPPGGVGLVSATGRGGCRARWPGAT